jgi:hypothetical protein
MAVPQRDSNPQSQQPRGRYLWTYFVSKRDVFIERKTALEQHGFGDV